MLRNRHSYMTASYHDAQTLESRREAHEAWKKKCAERKRISDLAKTDINAWRAEMMRELKGKTA